MFLIALFVASGLNVIFCFWWGSWVAGMGMRRHWSMPKEMLVLTVPPVITGTAIGLMATMCQ